MRPESRRSALLTQRVGDELIIYDAQSNEAHRLTQTAAWVWHAADGQRSVTDLSSMLRESLGRQLTSVSADDSEALVQLALAELDRTGLLAHALPKLGKSITRREMIGVTIALLPAISSIVAPSPAMAQTIPGLPVNPFADFNGVYMGTGFVADGEPNPCKFGQTPIVTILNVANPSVSFSHSLVIRHVNANQSFSFVSPSQTITVVQSSADSIVVEASNTVPLPPGGSPFPVFNTLSFGRSAGVVNMNGTQTFQGACGTFAYRINGRK